MAEYRFHIHESGASHCYTIQSTTSGTVFPSECSPTDYGVLETIDLTTTQANSINGQMLLVGDVTIRFVRTQFDYYIVIGEMNSNWIAPIGYYSGKGMLHNSVTQPSKCYSKEDLSPLLDGYKITGTYDTNQLVKCVDVVVSDPDYVTLYITNNAAYDCSFTGDLGSISVTSNGFTAGPYSKVAVAQDCVLYVSDWTGEYETGNPINIGFNQNSTQPFFNNETVVLKDLYNLYIHNGASVPKTGDTMTLYLYD